MAKFLSKYYDCPNCGTPVKKAESKAGNVYVSEPTEWYGEMADGRRVYATAHYCKKPKNWWADYMRKLANELPAGQWVKGQKVKVVRGRKLPIGTTGEIFWVGDNGYGESAGLLLADGQKVFTATRNLEREAIK